MKNKDKMKTKPHPPTKAQLKKEINLFKKQDHALDSSGAAHLTQQDRETLRGYYQDQIIARMRQLNANITATINTARAKGINVEFENITP